jgi:hypothetical protein
VKNINGGTWHCDHEYWLRFDVEAANSITNWKQQYVLTLGDVRLRSVVMAVSTAFCYRIASFRTNSFLRRTRNLAVSFGLMGITFVPELFNPFLLKEKL